MLMRWILALTWNLEQRNRFDFCLLWRFWRAVETAPVVCGTLKAVKWCRVSSGTRVTSWVSICRPLSQATPSYLGCVAFARYSVTLMWKFYFLPWKEYFVLFVFFNNLLHLSLPPLVLSFLLSHFSCSLPVLLYFEVDLAWLTSTLQLYLFRW